MGAFSRKLRISSNKVGFSVMASAVWVCYCTLSLNQHGMSEISAGIKVSIERGNTTMGTRRRTTKASSKRTAPMTDLATVSRVNTIDNHALPVGFVSDELLKLIEAPTIEPKIKFSAFVSFPDTFQVFHHNLVAIESSDNLFTYVMIDPSHEPFFPTTELLEKPSGTSSAFSLKFATQMPELAFSSFDFGRAEESVVGSDSNIIYADIDAKNLMRIRELSINVFSKTEQEETPVLAVNPQKRFSHMPIISEILPVTVRHNEWNFLPTFDCGQAENIILEGCTTREVISDTCSLYGGFGFGFLDHTTSLLDAGDCQLRRQSITQMSIDNVMELDVVANLLLGCSVDTELQSFGICSDSPDYLWRSIDFDFCSCSNSHLDSESAEIFKDYAFIPQLKQWVSIEVIL